MYDVRVIGIGNELRRDDGVGPYVAGALRRRQLPGVSVIERCNEPASLLDAWADARKVILVAAASSGSEVGTVHILYAHRDAIPSNFLHCSAHDFGVAEAVELARALEQLPPEIRVYGIEGQDFDSGRGVSPTIAQAADLLVADLVAEFASDPALPPPAPSPAPEH